MAHWKTVCWLAAWLGQVALAVSAPLEVPLQRVESHVEGDERLARSTSASGLSDSNNLIETQLEPQELKGSHPQPEAPQRPASQPAASQPIQLTSSDNFHAIEPNKAYRSAQLSAAKLRKIIAENKIAVVLNLRGANPDADWYQAEEAACKEAGVELINIALSASKRPSREALAKLYELFKTEKRPMLIHCRAGADRTGLASALYRICALGDSNEKALGQLSLKFGHFGFAHPHLSGVVREFRPDPNWIQSEYDPTRGVAPGEALKNDDE